MSAMATIPAWIRKRAYLAAKTIGPRDYASSILVIGVIANAIWSCVRLDRKTRRASAPKRIEVPRG